MRLGDMETWGRGDVEEGETWGHIDMETWRDGDMETQRHRDTETRRHGDLETWGHERRCGYGKSHAIHRYRHGNMEVQ